MSMDFSTSEHWKEHLRDNAEFQSKIGRVLFGDEDMDEKGMKAKVDEMHGLLIQAKTVGGFFGSVGGVSRWALTIVGVVALFKIWGAALIAWITLKTW